MTIVFVSVFGLIIGSFLNVVIYRIPEHKSIVYPSSRCPYCNTEIKPYDNIPVLSYIILRGRCRACGRHISLRYPVIELLTGVLFAGIYIKYGLALDLPVLFILTAGLVAVAFIDIDHRIIPNVITYPGIVLGFASSFFTGINSPVGSISGIAAGAGILLATAYIYKAVAGVEGMGMGDVKLMAMLGAFLGWEAVLFIVVMSAFIGSAAGIFLVIFAGKGRRYAVPFGPFISMAAILYLFYGQGIIAIYLRTIGYA